MSNDSLRLSIVRAKQFISCSVSIGRKTGKLDLKKAALRWCGLINPKRLVHSSKFAVDESMMQYFHVFFPIDLGTK